MPIYNGWTPSPAALRLPILPDGSEIVFDIFQWPANIVTPVKAFFAKKQSDGTWDYLAGGSGSTSSIWTLDVNDAVTYTHPDGTSLTGTFLAIANRYQYSLISAWIPKMNQIIAANGGSAPVGFPAASADAARQLLAGFVVVHLSAALVSGAPVISQK